jgi:hypothetical protein
MSDAGRYLHMMEVLPPIAGETFRRLTELVDMYTFAVFHFFAEDQVLRTLQQQMRQCGAEARNQL